MLIFLEAIRKSCNVNPIAPERWRVLGGEIEVVNPFLSRMCGLQTISAPSPSSRLSGSGPRPSFSTMSGSILAPLSLT